MSFQREIVYTKIKKFPNFDHFNGSNCQDKNQTWMCLDVCFIGVGRQNDASIICLHLSDKTRRDAKPKQQDFLCLAKGAWPWPRPSQSPSSLIAIGSFLASGRPNWLFFLNHFYYTSSSTTVIHYNQLYNNIPPINCTRNDWPIRFESNNRRRGILFLVGGRLSFTSQSTDD